MQKGHCVHRKALYGLVVVFLHIGGNGVRQVDVVDVDQGNALDVPRADPDVVAGGIDVVHAHGLGGKIHHERAPDQIVDLVFRQKPRGKFGFGQ